MRMQINGDLIVSGTNRTLADASRYDVYSENETKTNKIWIDGKPIYRKVFKFDKTGFNSNIDIKSGIDDLVNIRVMVQAEYQSQWRVVPWCYNDISDLAVTNWYSGFFIQDNIIRFQAGKMMLDAKKCIIIVEYTKV